VCKNKIFIYLKYWFVGDTNGKKPLQKKTNLWLGRIGGTLETKGKICNLFGVGRFPCLLAFVFVFFFLLVCVWGGGGGGVGG
jgi:hypothetical protein